MERKELGHEIRIHSLSADRTEQLAQFQSDGVPPDTNEVLTVRERRANLIEDIAYKLTDLITIISGRVELLCETVPSAHLRDLHEIRKTAMKGAVFSELLLRSVQACRKEMGI
jgi:hypothetical protein